MDNHIDAKTRLAQLKEEEAKLLAELSDQESYKPPIISSPMIQTQFIESQEIAFIDSRLEVVPGIITRVNPDETYDLEVYIPTSKIEMKWTPDRSSFDRIESTKLISQGRPRVRASDPRLVFRKQMVALAEAQRGTEGVLQTHIDTYIPQERKLLVPRFHDFHTSLVGTFFDPSIYNFKVHCFRQEAEIDHQKFPAVSETFPRKKPYYETFAKAYNRYFKEYHLGRSKKGSKWNSVAIQVYLKDS